MTNNEWVENRYLPRIRNKGKRGYACHYWSFKIGKADEPNREDYGIGAMAAQAVRINLNGLSQ